MRNCLNWRKFRGLRTFNTIAYTICLFFLSACGLHNDVVNELETQTEIEKENPVEENQTSEYVELQNVDWAAYKEIMPAEEYAALQEYLPVLTNEVTFHWIMGMTEEKSSQAVTMEEFERINVEEYYEGMWNFQLDSVKVCDLDANGTQELILEFRDLGYFSLILYYDEECFYGLEMGIRSFNGLQNNGVYIGSGGAAWSYYYQLEFDNEAFEEILLGHTECDEQINDEIYFIGEEQVDEDAFWKWESAIMTGDVPEYKPVAK